MNTYFSVACLRQEVSVALVSNCTRDLLAARKKLFASLRGSSVLQDEIRILIAQVVGRLGEIADREAEGLIRKIDRGLGSMVSELEGAKGLRPGSRNRVMQNVTVQLGAVNAMLCRFESDYLRFALERIKGGQAGADAYLQGARDAVPHIQRELANLAFMARSRRAEKRLKSARHAANKQHRARESRRTVNLRR